MMAVYEAPTVEVSTMSVDTQDHYPMNLSARQWADLEPQLPEAKSGPGKPGRPASDRRRVVEAILYLVKTGCQWRQLPPFYGCWQTVYGHFNRWSRGYHWHAAMLALSQEARENRGREAEPSAGCVDSQSVKAAMQPIESIGFDGNKKIKGRKRHVLVDTEGLIHCVVVTGANVGDRDGLRQVLARWFVKGRRRLRRVWVDSGYSGQALTSWVAGLKQTHKIALEVTERSGRGFQSVPRRWVVERTFAWFGGYRRLSKDYEVLPRNSEAMVEIAMISILLRRLAL
jgi:putative transposase